MRSVIFFIIAVVGFMLLGSPTKLHVQAADSQSAAASGHWAFQPIGDQPLPEVSGDWCHAPIDRFLLARLEARNLSPVADAEKYTLLRRAYFDLIGLPPSPDELAAFNADRSPNAFVKVVDRLLSSPHYGERWGRHWLDVARYADTAGETGDFPVPQAYHYRNYVIDAFQQDQPFDEFVREQIAGDILAAQDPGKRYRERVIATGYLAVTRRYGYNRMNDHHVMLGDCIDALGQSLMGLTLGCARCHDHKYEPISTADYYALYGILSSTKFAYPGSEHEKKPDDFVPLLPSADSRQLLDEIQQQLEPVNANLAQVNQELNQVAAEIRMLEAITSGPGAVEVRDGKLLIQSATPTMVVLQDLDEKDFVVTLTSASDAEAGILLRYKDVGNYFIANYQPQGEQIYFHEVVDGKATGYLAPTKAADLQPVIQLKATLRGSQATFTVSDGNRTFSTNYEVQKVHGSGTVGLFHNVTARQTFDDFSVSKPNNDNLYRDSFADPQVTMNRWKLAVGNWKLPEPDPAEADAETEARSKRIAELKVEQQRLEKTRNTAEKKSNELKAQLPVFETVYAVTEGEPKNARIHKQGDPKNLGEEVPRRFLTVLGKDTVGTESGSGRLELAGWLTRSTNPLTARVMVNRIWLHHFGQAIVRTPNNFGNRGNPPTHPRLLDYLATRFIESGWSVKSMHRQMMLSRAYRLASQHEARCAEVDPDNELCWKFNRRRLDAESIRDAMLLVSGQLDRSRGGPHPFPSPDSWSFSQHHPFRPSHEDYETNRRSVYLMRQRNRRNPFLELFDAADPRATTAQRVVTTTPAQALFAMNNAVVQERAEQFARRLLDGQANDAGRLDAAYRHVLGRPPQPDEVRAARTYLARYGDQLARLNLPGDEQMHKSWTSFAQILFSSNEFMYVE